jgi:hypothetical protein
VHGTWNYTLHPQLASCATEAEAAQVGAPGGPAQRRQAMLGQLTDLRLTGMTSTELERLAAALAPAQAARAQQRHRQQRGGRARRATGNLRSKPLFDDAARLLITLLYQRQVCSMNVLSDLLEVTAPASATPSPRPVKSSKTTATPAARPPCASPPPTARSWIPIPAPSEPSSSSSSPTRP